MSDIQRGNDGIDCGNADCRYPDPRLQPWGASQDEPEAEGEVVSDKKKESKRYPHSPYSEKWLRDAGELAMAYCPGIHTCRDCGGPVIKGYCCEHCGSGNP